MTFISNTETLKEAISVLNPNLTDKEIDTIIYYISLMFQRERMDDTKPQNTYEFRYNGGGKVTLSAGFSFRGAEDEQILIGELWAFARNDENYSFNHFSQLLPNIFRMIGHKGAWAE